MSIENAFADEWDEGLPVNPGWEQRARRLIVPGRDLGVSLYELLPAQTQCAYHFHHGNEEFLLVLRGTPTVRTPEGEHELAPGDALHFPKGPAGAHQIVNRSAEPARYLITASQVSPELIEYPDSGKILAMSREESHRGGPLRTVHRLDDAVDYFEGEEPLSGRERECESPL